MNIVCVGRIARQVFVPIGLAVAISACSTRFDAPSSLSSSEQLIAGERRLLAVEEYADRPALARMERLYLPPVALAVGADIDPDITPARLDDVRRQLSRDLCQRLAQAGLISVPWPIRPATRSTVRSVRRSRDCGATMWRRPDCRA